MPCPLSAAQACFDALHAYQATLRTADAALYDFVLELATTQDTRDIDDDAVRKMLGQWIPEYQPATATDNTT